MANFDLSYSEALNIQRAQLAYYRQYLGYHGYKNIRAFTQPCPPGTHPDTPISIFTINELIPRGGSIENLVNKLSVIKRRRRILYGKVQIDQTNSAMHDAIRRGLL